MSTPTPRTLAGIVVSAGKMMKTVKVRIAQQVFNPHIRKVPHRTPFRYPSLPSPYPRPTLQQQTLPLTLAAHNPSRGRKSLLLLHTSPRPRPPMLPLPLTSHAPPQYFPSSTTHLVHDPTSVLREGDIVRIAAGWRVSRRKRHVVTEVVAAFGAPVEKRARGALEKGGSEEGEGLEGGGEERTERRGLVPLEELVRAREARREAKRARREGRKRERVEEAEGDAGSGEGR